MSLFTSLFTSLCHYVTIDAHDQPVRKFRSTQKLGIGSKATLKSLSTLSEKKFELYVFHKCEIVRYFSFAHNSYYLWILNVCALSRDTTKIVFLFFKMVSEIVFLIEFHSICLSMKIQEISQDLLKYNSAKIDEQQKSYLLSPREEMR